MEAVQHKASQELDNAPGGFNGLLRCSLLLQPGAEVIHQLVPTSRREVFHQHLREVTRRLEAVQDGGEYLHHLSRGLVQRLPDVPYAEPYATLPVHKVYDIIVQVQAAEVQECVCCGSPPYLVVPGTRGGNGAKEEGEVPELKHVLHG